MDYSAADELQHQLMNEHQKVADLQQELQGVGSNRQSVRELQEQIRDIQVKFELQITGIIGTKLSCTQTVFLYKAEL